MTDAAARESGAHGPRATPATHGLVSRRALGRAAVWSVPVIAGVAMAPAAAASPPQTKITVSAVCSSSLVSLSPRGFTLTVNTGSLPVNSTFTITSSAGGLTTMNVTATGATTTVNKDGTVATLTTQVPLAAPGSATVSITIPPTLTAVRYTALYTGTTTVTGTTSATYSVTGVTTPLGGVVVGQSCSA